MILIANQPCQYRRIDDFPSGYYGYCVYVIDIGLETIAIPEAANIFQLDWHSAPPRFDGREFQTMLNGKVELYLYKISWSEILESFSDNQKGEKKLTLESRARLGILALESIMRGDLGIHSINIDRDARLSYEWMTSSLAGSIKNKETSKSYSHNAKLGSLVVWTSDCI